jgi:hypothetical protein
MGCKVDHLPLFNAVVKQTGNFNFHASLHLHGAKVNKNKVVPVLN